MPHELRPAVFLHIQKTAGTSVQEMAREVYGNENVISHGDYIGLGLEGCRSIPFVSGHFGFTFAEALMPGRYGFTFLRNPFDRLISLYRFCLSRPAEEQEIYRIAQEGDFLNFLEPIHGTTHWWHIWNHQVGQLYLGWGAEYLGEEKHRPWETDEHTVLNSALLHINRFDFVGFQETLSADAQHIFNALGAPGVAARRSNVAAARSAYSDLPLRTKRRLYDVTKLDWMLYEHAVEKHAAGAIPITRGLKIRSRVAHVGMQGRNFLSRSAKIARK